MEALRPSSSPSFHFNPISRRPFGPKDGKPILFNLTFIQQPNSCLPSFQWKKANFRISATLSSDISTEPKDSSDQETHNELIDEKFNWYEHWYPVMPICDLDKSRPHGKRILGIDIVVWWDRNENDWKVMDDACPHRLAPLSDGRIDQWGRLQCVYHGWCFDGSGKCKLIPQAPRDGPPIHNSTRACTAVYPSCVQNKILWFWPNADHQYKDILSKKKPPYFPELDDPSFTDGMITRDIPYGYEVLIENLMDPAHVAYAHYGILKVPEPPKSIKADREGGRPLDISMKTFGINGFTSGTATSCAGYVPPCLYYSSFNLLGSLGNESTLKAGATENQSSTVAEKRAVLIFLCIPVSPGNSRLIFAQPRNFGVWIDRVIPRWIFHIRQNLVLDSDLYLLHVEERKIREIGLHNWHNTCFVPTKADVNVVNFRRWLNKYSVGEVDWGTKFSGDLPPTPPREQLMDRYWTHTTICRSCNLAYRSLNAIELALQVLSIALVGIVAAGKQGLLSMAAKYSLVSTAILCFLASKWLSHFIYRTYRFHDYDHAKV